MTTSNLKPRTCIHRVLLALYELPEGQTLNYQQAGQRLYAPHLHSVISDIENRMGIPVQRKQIAIEGYAREKTYCRGYWLDEDGKRQTKPHLDRMESRRQHKGGKAA